MDLPSPRRRCVRLLMAAALCAGPATAAGAQTAVPPADSAAIRATALDYIEGWFTGDSLRMSRAVHPALAKRIVDARSSPPALQESPARELVAGTARGYGRRVPAERRRTDVTILDVVGNAASVRIDAGEWIDYLHVARLGGRWQIVNVLWERTARPPAE